MPATLATMNAAPCINRYSPYDNHNALTGSIKL
jgi:hypothetical protein